LLVSQRPFGGGVTQIRHDKCSKIVYLANKASGDYSIGFFPQCFFQLVIHSSSVHLISVDCVVSMLALSIIQALYASRDRSFGPVTVMLLYCLFSI
jgi:hypothetical protein